MGSQTPEDAKTTPKRSTVIPIVLLAAAAILAFTAWQPLAAPGVPSHDDPVDQMIRVLSSAPRSPILDELDAAHEELNVSIWGHEDPTGITLRVACDHLTQARDLATGRGTPLDAHLRNRISNLRAYTCEVPDASATRVHDRVEQLYLDVADQVG